METNMKKIRETDLTKLIKTIINEKKQLTEDKKFTCHECRPTGRRGKGECHHSASFLGTSRPADCMSWDDCLLECEGVVIDYDKVRQNTGNPADTYGGERRVNEETEWGCCCEWQSCDHPVTTWYSKMCCIGGWGCRCNGRPLANIAPADNEKDCRARCKDNSECQEACISGRIPPSTSPRGEEGLDRSRIRIRETELTNIIKKIINEQSNLSYDEFLEEMLKSGQTLQKLVEVIRKGNPTEMGSWGVRTEENALGEFREVADFTMSLINEFKVGVNESKQSITERKNLNVR